MTSRVAPTRAALGRPVGSGSSPGQLVRRPSPKQPGIASRVAETCWRFTLRRPGAVACSAMALALSSAFGWNALMHQANRHPAPLFGTKAPGTSSDVQRRVEPAVAPLPVPRPDAAALPAVPDVPAKANKNDPIGAMIRSAEAGGKPDEPRPDPARVTSAQRALSKLGYGPLKSDGVMGATTRQALERFERDQNLPVTGSLAGRTVRQLSAQAGAAPD